MAAHEKRHVAARDLAPAAAPVKALAVAGAVGPLEIFFRPFAAGEALEFFCGNGRLGLAVAHEPCGLLSFAAECRPNRRSAMHCPRQLLAPARLLRGRAALLAG